MAIKSSKDYAFLLIGGRSLLGRASFQTITEEREIVTEDITGLGDTTDKWGAVGLSRFSMEQEGLYDSGAGGWSEAAESTANQVLMGGPVGNNVGDDIIAFTGVRASYSKLPERAGFIKAKASYKAESGIEEMSQSRIIAPFAERTLVGPSEVGTFYDWSSATTGGGALYIGVSALTLAGSTGVAITAQHSATTVTSDFVTLGSFSAITVAPTSERVAVSGTVRRYTRVSHTFSAGSTTTRAITFVVGLGRKR
jgi:hypothetical protein